VLVTVPWRRVTHRFSGESAREEQGDEATQDAQNWIVVVGKSV
jgi:hypothetical protein